MTRGVHRYRRKTANARERSRMREINEAFEALRRAVPHLAVDAHNEKLTKITTLRLAMKYISALNGLLTAPAATAVASPASAAAASATAADTRCDDGRAAAVSACLAAMAGGCGGSSVASETTASSVSSDVDSLLGEYTTAADLLSECSSGTPPGFLDHFGGGFRDVMCAGGGPAYSLSPSSCSTADVGFPSLLAAADFADAAAFMQPFSDHPLPPIDFNGDPYIFEDNFATEFS